MPAATDPTHGDTSPRVPPLDPPMVPFAIGGIVLWAVVGLALLPFRHTLQEQGHGDWLWICLAGFLWGFPGLAVMLRHDARRRRARAAAADLATSTSTGPAPEVSAADVAAGPADVGARTGPGTPADAPTEVQRPT